MTIETKSNNLLWEVLKEVPKDALKRWCVRLFTIGLVILGGFFYSKKTIGQLFPKTFSNVIVYARLTGIVAPGEAVELYPPSLQKVVPLTGEVEWELPFEQIASSTLELQRFSTNAQGRLAREILAQLPVKDKPALAFVLERVGVLK